MVDFWGLDIGAFGVFSATPVRADPSNSVIGTRPTFLSKRNIACETL